MTPVCPYCDVRSVLASSAEVYGGRDYGPIYLCRPCNAWVGCHVGTTLPLGRLADAVLRTWKTRAHDAFDPIWQGAVDAAFTRHGFFPKGVKARYRSAAYGALAGLLGIPKPDCHIGMFDVDTCRRVIELCETGRLVRMLAPDLRT